jgi:hypothetical protein
MALRNPSRDQQADAVRGARQDEGCRLSLQAGEPSLAGAANQEHRVKTGAIDCIQQVLQAMEKLQLGELMQIVGKELKFDLVLGASARRSHLLFKQFTTDQLEAHVPRFRTSSIREYCKLPHTLLQRSLSGCPSRNVVSLTKINGRSRLTAHSEVRPEFDVHGNTR